MEKEQGKEKEAGAAAIVAAVIKCENPLKAENQTNFIEYQINMFIKMRTLN